MLDIYDINYEFCSEDLGNLNFPSAILPKKGVFLRIVSLFKGVVKYGMKRTTNSCITKNTTLFFVFAQNEINSVQPIVNQLPNSKLFGIDSFKNGYPIFKIYFYSLFFVPVVFYRLIICKDAYHKKSFQYAFDGFCIAYASRYILKKYLKEIEPTKIVIANQLSCFHRSLAFTAKELNIETVYIQHASVTKNFSNLNIFSSALLEGEDSLIKFQSNGTVNKDLFLIGMPKFDKYFFNISKKTVIESIGICTNGMDDFESYRDLLLELIGMFPDVKIFVRPHPADRRKLDWYNLAIDNNCLFSDVAQVESFQFFDDVSFIIAGDSNIHLEAALLNIPSVYYDPSENNVDWYGFSSQGLVFYAKDKGSVIDHIKKVESSFPDTRVKTKFYSESVNTRFDGKSADIAAKVLMGSELDHCFVKRVDDSMNTIYRIR